MADEEDTGPKYVFVTSNGDVRKEGSRHYNGKATASYPNGDLYEGDFEAGIREGRGCYRYAGTGDKYEGAWVQNKRHGLGTMTYNGKGVYQGYWENNYRHGEGVFTYPSGDVYSGWFRFGNKEGTGTYYSTKSGMKLTGEWKDNKIVTGNWVLANGTHFEGSYNENKPDGAGMWVFQNGNELRGKYAQVRGEPGEDADGNPLPGELLLEWIPDKSIVESALKMNRNGNVLGLTSTN